jgi:hypothetical protein
MAKATARLLGGKVHAYEPDEQVLARMRSLAEEKYGAPGWLRKLA